MGKTQDCRSERLDDGRRIQRGLRALAVSARAECRDLLGGVGVALRRRIGRCRRTRRTDGTAAPYRFRAGGALCTFRRCRSPQPHSRGDHGGCGRLADGSRRQDGGSDVSPAARLGSVRRNRRLRRRRDHALAVAVGLRRAGAGEHCLRVVQAMNDKPLLTLASYFAMLSLFAVGGANAAIPEMHRISVDVMHWMNDRQFADMFAIAQVSPGPNIIIVTLIGYHVAGFAGAAVATAAMCGPTCLVAFVVARTWDRFKEARWRIAIQAGLVPGSLGLISASAFVLASSADHNIYAAAITATTAIVGFATRINPLWLFAAGGLLGLSGWL